MVDDDALNGRWTREQVLLGLDRNTPDEEFARGGVDTAWFSRFLAGHTAPARQARAGARSPDG